MSLDAIHLTSILESVSDDTLAQAILMMTIREVMRLPFAAATVKWADPNGKEWDLEGRCLVIGTRAVLWTHSDEAGDTDHIVIKAPADPVTAAHEYAVEIVDGLTK